MTTYQTRLFTDILNLLATIPQATDYAAGTLRQDLRQLLAEYATADFTIVRCSTGTHNQPQWIENDKMRVCRLCEQPFDRLLSDGTWQSQAARDKLNLARLEEAR